MNHPIDVEEAQQRPRCTPDPDAGRHQGESVGCCGLDRNLALLLQFSTADLLDDLDFVALRGSHAGLLLIEPDTVQHLRVHRILRSQPNKGEIHSPIVQQLPLRRGVEHRGADCFPGGAFCEAPQPLLWEQPCHVAHPQIGVAGCGLVIRCAGSRVIHSSNGIVTKVTDASSTAMKPLTAAKKLGIYLPAAPEEFQNTALSREEFQALVHTPPQWLTDLRANGPHPKDVVAHKLRITIAALKRQGLDATPLTTAEIQAILDEGPEWLHTEQRTLATERQAQTEAQQAKERKAAARRED